jgi:hypothetical protein
MNRPGHQFPPITPRSLGPSYIDPQLLDRPVESGPMDRREAMLIAAAEAFFILVVVPALVVGALAVMP